MVTVDQVTVVQVSADVVTFVQFTFKQVIANHHRLVQPRLQLNRLVIPEGIARDM